MKIDKVVIKNFKRFKGRFSLELNAGVNIIVGDNEAGKSTILEAINLALTGYYCGRHISMELSQYLFNESTVNEFLDSLRTGHALPPPEIHIELFLSGEDITETALSEGDGNSDKVSYSGISFKIKFNDEYKSEYEALISSGDVKTIPIEYYHVDWKNFARASITSRSIPLKSALIDSSSTRYQNGSDVYIGRIVKGMLSPGDIVNISQSHRGMREYFMEDESIEAINKKISEAAKITEKSVKLSVDLSTRNAWENSLITCLDNIPFHFIGKGEQSIIKTNLALAHNKAKEANVILVEEPENHLSHTKLNSLVKIIKDNHADKQVIVTTHSSFVANKLGLDDLILLNDEKTFKLDELSDDTRLFFEKISGYDTLRLILCKKAILVEGDSDELVVQRAYKDNNGGALPIENCVEVISVGTSFLRFLEVAEKLGKAVSVLTDNDGDVNALNEKYERYIGENKREHIDICFDEKVDGGELLIGTKSFNYNTLEPKILKVNSLEKFNKIFEVDYKDVDDMHKYMRRNKTDCALKIYSTTEKVNYPEYILEAIK
ncbi:AAA family ATPase [Hahella sp. CR1]|uniref:ATP-dependent nuclease n=1 Tax=Hahella sp. CR1 TaxID=2992807 RepID=UPI00244180A2|nr:AAA family ATPase [Hahella sp. CR1]MDG9667065.1 AAA family ATPase [Hahella sp. CR1]